MSRKLKADGCTRKFRLHPVSIDRPDLRAVTQPKRIEQLWSAIGIDGGAGASTADGDIGGGGIDGVGAKTLQMGKYPLGGSALGGMDGAGPTGADMAIGEMTLGA